MPSRAALRIGSGQRNAVVGQGPALEIALAIAIVVEALTALPREYATTALPIDDLRQRASKSAWSPRRSWSSPKIPIRT